MNPITAPIARMIFVEDEVSTAKYYKDNLKVVLRSENCYIVPECRLVSTFEEFRQEVEDPNYARTTEYSNAIIDINLGVTREEDGFKVLELINNKYPNRIKPFVLTGNVNKRNMDKCAQLGVTNDRFFEKSFFEPSTLAPIRTKIQEIFLNGYKNNSNMFKGALTIRNIAYENNYDYRINYSSNKFPSIGEEYSEYGRFALFNFMTNKLKEGTSFFTVEKKLWELETFGKSNAEKKLSQFTLIHKEDPKTGNIEGISLAIHKKAIFDLSIPNFETLEDSCPIIENFILKNAKTEGSFVEFFVAKRLVNFYLCSKTVERSRVVDIATRLLKSNFIQLIFIYYLWEYYAKKEKSSLKASERLRAISKKIPYSINEVFYCEIEDKYEEENVAKVRFENIEGEEIEFYREIELSMLDHFGLNNLHARFVMIMYTHLQNPGSSYVFLPIPPNAS